MFFLLPLLRKVNWRVGWVCKSKLAVFDSQHIFSQKKKKKKDISLKKNPHKTKLPKTQQEKQYSKVADNTSLEKLQKFSYLR